MDVVYQGARNPSACKKRHKILCAKGARNPAQAGKKIASPKAINYIKHCSTTNNTKNPKFPKIITVTTTTTTTTTTAGL